MGLYAAYGSNLDPDRMALRAPHSILRGSGWLVGWRLTFGGEDRGWEGALGTVVEQDGHQVYVALYDVPDGDERLLDEWEGVAIGLFRKVTVRVQTLDGDAKAWLYVLDAYEGGMPSATYLSMLAESAEKGGAPGDYCHEMRQRPCASFDEPLPPA